MVFRQSCHLWHMMIFVSLYIVPATNSIDKSVRAENSETTNQVFSFLGICCCLSRRRVIFLHTKKSVNVGTILSGFYKSINQYDILWLNLVIWKRRIATQLEKYTSKLWEKSPSPRISGGGLWLKNDSKGLQVWRSTFNVQPLSVALIHVAIRPETHCRLLLHVLFLQKKQGLDTRPPDTPSGA